MNTIKAKVVDFDRRRGEGMIKGLKGEGTVIVYASNIPGKKTWYAETACVYYEKNAIIDLTLDDEGFFVPVTPGIFDEEKWNNLDHDRLAFRCDEAGKATNGLFSSTEKRKKK